MLESISRKLGLIAASEKLPAGQTYVWTGIFPRPALFAFNKFFRWGKVIKPKWWSPMKEGDCLRKKIQDNGDDPDGMPKDNERRDFVESIAGMLSFGPPQTMIGRFL